MTLLSLRNVTKRFSTPAGDVLAVDDVSLDVARGECVAIVGESGSGKSTIANMILGIYPPSEGEIAFDGATLPARRSLQHRRLVQLVQQNPLSSLNPRRSIAASLRLALDVHDIGARADRPALMASLLTTLPITPAGLGVVETAIIVVLKWVDVTPSLATSVAVLDRLITYWSLILIGLILYIKRFRSEVK